MKAHLITRQGWQALDKELKYLWKEYRPQITLKVQEAAAQGDRSENADYTYNKRLLRQIDGRVRYLVKRLEELKIVDYSPQQEGKIYFGAWFELENEAGERVRYRIVGKDELDTKLGYITIDSPMARALIGKQVDDEVVVQTPSGPKEWYINQIRYTPFEDNLTGAQESLLDSAG
ncbi:transcription elongation factor GreB [Shewanella morhuae]|uniref:Transcription elongation factor GreB n=1 Tax=Shewanella morhuae TaxID=365591 RepID=A0A380B1P8_9GAMM|nr:transcription elongation factor GreB [Shewanella morhuae]SUI90859.1 Transcript cleavage factor greB [Shewanella morhuae]